MDNELGAIGVPCSLFAGLNTELSPSDIPEGVSPDNSDVVFVPGSVKTRPAAQRLLNNPIGSNSIVYHKTYLQPNGFPLTMLLASDGTLYKEDVINSPGNTYSISPGGGVPSTKGSYAKSVTAFGREYIAFSDGTYGLDIPRQYDGVNLERATQDGPGTLNVTISQQTQTVAITSIGPINTLTISTVTEYGTLVTVTTTTAHGLVAGDVVIVNCNDPIFSNSNQPITVEEVNTPTSFSYSVGVDGITGVTGGTVYALKVTMTTAAPHGLLLGDMFSVSGNSWPLYNSATTYATGDPPQSVSLNLAIAGKPPAGTTEAFSPAPVTQTINFAANFAGSSGSCGTNPSSNVSFGIGCDGPFGIRNLGLCAVNTSGVFTFTTTGGLAQVLYPGETLTAYNPTPQNSTLSDVSFVVVGNAVATATTPPQWQVTEVPSPTTVTFNSVSDNVETGTGGTAIIGGQISAGQHKMVMFLELFNGEQTNPSPPVTFNADAGTRITISNLPTVYSNVKTLNFGFTLSGGDNYFYIPVVPTGESIYGVTQPIGTATVVAAGASSVTFDFGDTTLASATAIDIPGNNLFNQVKLAPCLGFFSYASRLLAWGEPNVIVNLMNTGFDGGYDSSAPHQATGWTTGGGSINFTFSSPLDQYSTGEAVAIGPGTAILQQGVYQDPYGIAILQPKTSYSVKLRAVVTNPSLGGTLTVDFYSPTSGSLCGGALSFPMSAMQQVGSTNSAWIGATFSLQTGATIPSDAILKIQAVVPSGQSIALDEFMPIYAQNPWRTVARVSYAINPGGFDNETGILGTTSDPTPIQCFSTIRDILRMKTAAGTYRTQDNPGAEPSDWQNLTLSGRVGALSFRASDPGQWGEGDTGEEWEIVATRSGVYITEGGPFYKISQEIQTIWDRINFTISGTGVTLCPSMWVKNDTVARRCYFGVPLDGATAPNVILVMDYREMDTAQNIASGAPIHISFTGRMIASDLTRKWTSWSLATCSGELIERQDPSGVQFTIGCGNGVTPGSEPSFGEIYQFNSSKYTDDDYGHIPARYTTYFFINHEAEIALGVGSHMKLFPYFSAYVTGLGNLMVTPLASSLTNSWPSPPQYPLSSAQNSDFEWGLNVSTERCAFQFQAVPQSGTDSWFNLQKLVVSIMKHPMYPIRGLVQ